MSEQSQLAPIVERMPQQILTTPQNLLAIAVQRGAGMEELSKLMDLQDRHDAREARKAYVAAMAAFKREPLEVLKRKRVAFGETEYFHAELSDVTDAVCPALGKHGLSHAWDIEQGAQIKVTCTITHEFGHSESVSMSAPPDQSGKKNAIQQVASTVTYLQRYTLLAICGIATKGQDDDARTGDGEGFKPLTDEQIATINDYLTATGADRAKFLAFMGANAVEEIAAADYQRAIDSLKAKERATRKGAA